MLSDFEMGRNFEKMAESLRKQNKFNAETKRVVNNNARFLNELTKKHNGLCKCMSWSSALFLCLDLLIAWNAYDIYKLQKRVDKLENRAEESKNCSK